MKNFKLLNLKLRKIHNQQQAKKLTTPRNADGTSIKCSLATNLIKNMVHKSYILDLMQAESYKYNDISFKKLQNTAMCGSRIQFIKGFNPITKTINNHIKKGIFCSFRMCPVNAKMKARARVKEIYTILKAMYDKKGYLPIFITLTLPNIKRSPKSVKKVIYNLTHSWHKMAKNPKYDGYKQKGMLKGFIQKIEHTYNNKKWTKAYGTLNYHTHIIGIVRKSYYNKYGSKYFISQQQIQKDWEHYTHNKTAITDIEAPYYKDCKGNHIHPNPNGNKKGLNKAIQQASKEIAKYEGKSADFGKMPTLHKKISKGEIDKEAHQIASKKIIKEFQRKVETQYNCQCSYKQAKNWLDDDLKNGYHSKIKLNSNDIKKDRRQVIKNNLNTQQTKALEAFHAVYRGEFHRRLFIFGGCCKWYHKLYKWHMLRKYEPQDNTIYKFKILSKYQYKAQCYSDNKIKELTDPEKLSLRMKGFKTAPLKLKSTIIHFKNWLKSEKNKFKNGSSRERAKIKFECAYI